MGGVGEAVLELSPAGRYVKQEFWEPLKDS